MRLCFVCIFLPTFASHTHCGKFYLKLVSFNASLRHFFHLSTMKMCWPSYWSLLCPFLYLRLISNVVYSDTHFVSCPYLNLTLWRYVLLWLLCWHCFAFGCFLLVVSFALAAMIKVKANCVETKQEFRKPDILSIYWGIVFEVFVCVCVKRIIIDSENVLVSLWMT